jgi:hypothetical protein
LWFTCVVVVALFVGFAFSVDAGLDTATPTVFCARGAIFAFAGLTDAIGAAVGFDTGIVLAGLFALAGTVFCASGTAFAFA